MGIIFGRTSPLTENSQNHYDLLEIPAIPNQEQRPLPENPKNQLMGEGVKS